MKKIFLILIICVSASAVNSQWSEQQAIPTPPKLNCVSANIGGIEGWIGGDSGVVLYTNNGGTNWNYRNCPIAGSNSINVISVVSRIAYYTYTISGKALCSFTNLNAAFICRTSNGGVNWTTVYQKPGRIRSINMLDSSYGIAVGDPVGGWWKILKTTNGGMSFDSLYSVPSQNGSELSNYNSMIYGRTPFDTLLMFGTNSGRIYRSANNGLNWTSITLPFQNILTLQLGKFHMSNQLTSYGYAAGSGAAASTDFGVTWTAKTLPGSGNITSFHTEFGVLGNFACYSRGSIIYSSTNYTLPFTVQYTSPNGGNYTQISLSVFVFEGGFRGGWAVKDNGKISRYYVMWAGISKINSEVPVDFSLSQNYPNPFNPVTKIRFDIPPFTKGGQGGFVTMKIYDVLGCEVTTLVNEQLKPGTYEVEFDGTNYPSGVYFYKFITADYSETRKMVLVK
jgi:photosystem II stability/assembly factor-like uncharacterized protein